MQQYTQDIWRGLQEIFGDGAKVLGPRTRMGLIVFPFIAFLYTSFLVLFSPQSIILLMTGPTPVVQSILGIYILIKL